MESGEENAVFVDLNDPHAVWQLQELGEMANSCLSILYYGQRKLTFVEGSLYLQWVSSLTRLDLTYVENVLLFVCSEVVEYKLLKLETSHTVILPQRSVFCCVNLHALHL